VTWLGEFEFTNPGERRKAGKWGSRMFHVEHSGAEENVPRGTFLVSLLFTIIYVVLCAL
jgi:hypothetical protein